MRFFSAMMIFAAWMLTPLQCGAEEALGRLFYTPEQRARMDVARQHERSIKIDEEESAPPPVNIHLNGIITRSDGRSTVWINNKVQSGEAAAQGVVVGGKGTRSGEVGVTIPGVRGNVPLKVGQSIDVTSGQVEEIYRRPPAASISAKETPSTPSSASAEKTTMPARHKNEPVDEIQGEAPPPR